MNEMQIIENRLILLEHQIDKLFGFTKGLIEISEQQNRLINNLTKILNVTEYDLTF